MPEQDGDKLAARLKNILDHMFGSGIPFETPSPSPSKTPLWVNGDGLRAEDFDYPQGIFIQEKIMYPEDVIKQYPGYTYVPLPVSVSRPDADDGPAVIITPPTFSDSLNKYIDDYVEDVTGMAWDYEKGCEVPGVGVISPMERTKIQPSTKSWEELESDVELLEARGVGGAVLAAAEMMAKRAYQEKEKTLAAAKGLSASQARKLYIEWLQEASVLRTALPDSKKEIESLNDLPPMERIITAGYRHLAKQIHPDNLETGDANKFHELKMAKLKLDKLITEMKGMLE